MNEDFDKKLQEEIETMNGKNKIRVLVISTGEYANQIKQRYNEEVIKKADNL